MTDEIRDRIDTNLVEAKEARGRGDWVRCWQLLEDAHVLSQPWAWPHTRVHSGMLASAWRSRDRREIRGQVLRLLVGGPASTVGRYPIGNSGRARVPATRAMPVQPDLAEMLQRAGQRAS
ncbi:MAG: DUF3703 domain-containing protein [Actinobacteria bacterium]|nr:DUF3703 domain-containing protein [Actinomycetota bacterium]